MSRTRIGRHVVLALVLLVSVTGCLFDPSDDTTPGAVAARVHINDLLVRLGRAAEAADAYDAALALATNPAEQRFLADRRAALG